MSDGGGPGEAMAAMKRTFCRIFGHAAKRYRPFLAFADGFVYRSRIEHCDRCGGATAEGY